VLLPVEGYSPLSPGIENRVNALAAVGYVLGTVGVIASAVLLVPRRWRQGIAPRIAVACLATVVGVLFLRVLMAHERQYAASVDAQAAALETLSRLPRPPEGAAIYLGDVEATAGPNIPIFAASWDLTGALRVLWKRESIVGVPVGSVIDLECTPAGVRPVHPGLYSPAFVTPYRDAVFVSAHSGASTRAASPAECRRIAESYGFPVE
jgi:hypothetical protein